MTNDTNNMQVQYASAQYVSAQYVSAQARCWQVLQMTNDTINRQVCSVCVCVPLHTAPNETMRCLIQTPMRGNCRLTHRRFLQHIGAYRRAAIVD